MADHTDYDHPARPSTAQPPPVHVPGAESVHDLVIADLNGSSPALAALLAERKRFGLAKYGTVLQVEDPARDPTQDLIEELGDALVYAYRARALGVRGADIAYRALAGFADAVASLWYVGEGEG